MKQCLAITATVRPNSVMVAQDDIETRRKEYLAGLDYYIQNYECPIYFIENSDFDFDKDKDFSALFDKKNVNLVKYPVSKEFKKGKGYQEFEMLDGLVDQINQDFDEVIKVTGRYIIANFKELLNQKNRGLIIDRHKKKGVAISAFFRSRLDIYLQHIKGAYKEVNDSEGVFIEHILYKRFRNTKNVEIDLFSKNPVYRGVSGSYGASLNRNPIKMRLRNIERKVLEVRGKKEFGIEY